MFYGLQIRKVKQLIGKRIRKIRESKDYSQENIAGELGITTSAYSKIERGVTDTSTSKLIKIAEILEVEVSQFFIDLNPKEIKIEEIKLPYGFATKNDIEEVMRIIHKMNTDIQSLKEKITINVNRKK